MTISIIAALAAPNDALPGSDSSTFDGFVIQGIEPIDRGWYVNGAGDMNGDGLADLVLGASNATSNGQEQAGETYVVFGSITGYPEAVNVGELSGNDGFTIRGVDPREYSGSRVDRAGDINGDGLGDVIIGAPGVCCDGASYVVFGFADSSTQQISTSELNGTNGFVFAGRTGDYSLGGSISAAGDINGDGFGDVIIGSPLYPPRYYQGISYVVFGAPELPPMLDREDLDGSNGFAFRTINNGFYAGTSVSSAGDFNGDGIDDVIIGAPGHYCYNCGSPGRSFIVFGKKTGFPARMFSSDLNGENGLVLVGTEPNDFAGSSVASAGDINGDGLDDVVIAAPGPRRARRGQTHMVFGSTEAFPASLELSQLTGSNGFTMRISGSLGAAGDFNGDGLDDVIVGGHVLFGREAPFPAMVDAAWLNTSNSLSFPDNRITRGAGDVNGDGIDDVIDAPTFADTENRRSHVKFGAQITIFRDGFEAIVVETRND